MMRSIAFRVAAVILLGLVGAGCALTSKADLVGTRYFTPEVPRTQTHGASSRAAAAATSPELRLGRVTSGPHLRERIAYRDAAYEVGYYEDQRWTERPEIYVRRRITRTLFEDHGLRRVLGGSAPTLDVEVVAFDEVRLPTGSAARVELKVVLYEDRAVLFEETLTVDHPIAGASGKPKIEEIVAAMGHALDAVAEQTALRVGERLAIMQTAKTPPIRPRE